MANKPATLPTFEADRFYAVNLARSTTWKGKPLSPAHNPCLLYTSDAADE